MMGLCVVYPLLSVAKSCTGLLRVLLSPCRCACSFGTARLLAVHTITAVFPVAVARNFDVNHD